VIAFFVLIVVALVCAAGGLTIARHARETSGWTLAILLVGMALCLSIEAGRNWT
jgi:hypothetical protein